MSNAMAGTLHLSFSPAGATVQDVLPDSPAASRRPQARRHHYRRRRQADARRSSRSAITSAAHGEQTDRTFTVLTATARRCNVCDHPAHPRRWTIRAPHIGLEWNQSEFGIVEDAYGKFQVLHPEPVRAGPLRDDVDLQYRRGHRLEQKRRQTPAHGRPGHDDAGLLHVLPEPRGLASGPLVQRGAEREPRADQSAAPSRSWMAATSPSRSSRPSAAGPVNARFLEVVQTSLRRCHYRVSCSTSPSLTCRTTSFRSRTRCTSRQRTPHPAQPQH